MEQDKLQKLLLKHGSTPSKSVRIFVLGLFLFFLALSLIYLGSSTNIWWQIVGLVLLIIAVVTALTGYLGILANRLAFFRHQTYQNRQKYKNIK